jgi:hypothetical protein
MATPCLTPIISRTMTSPDAASRTVTNHLFWTSGPVCRNSDGCLLGNNHMQATDSVHCNRGVSSHSGCRHHMAVACGCHVPMELSVFLRISNQPRVCSLPAGGHPQYGQRSGLRVAARKVWNIGGSLDEIETGISLTSLSMGVWRGVSKGV